MSDDDDDDDFDQEDEVFDAGRTREVLKSALAAIDALEQEQSEVEESWKDLEAREELLAIHARWINAMVAWFGIEIGWPDPRIPGNDNELGSA